MPCRRHPHLSPCPPLPSCPASLVARPHRSPISHHPPRRQGHSSFMTTSCPDPPRAQGLHTHCLVLTSLWVSHLTDTPDSECPQNWIQCPENLPLSAKAPHLLALHTRTPGAFLGSTPLSPCTPFFCVHLLTATTLVPCTMAAIPPAPCPASQPCSLAPGHPALHQLLLDAVPLLAPEPL